MIIYVCNYCNSPDIEIQAWGNPNTETIAYYSEFPDYYCNKCRRWYEKEEPQEIEE